MTDGSITNEDRVLFFKIAQEIKNNPSNYRESGTWFDGYCTKDGFCVRAKADLQMQNMAIKDNASVKKERQRIYEAALKSGMSYENDREILRFIMRMTSRCLDMTTEIKISHLKAFLKHEKATNGKIELIDLWLDAMDHCRETWTSMHSINSEYVRRTLLMTWLITDQDENITKLKITKFAELPWSIRSPLFFYTIAPGKRRCQDWMEAVILAWQIVQSGQTEPDTIADGAGEQEHPPDTMPLAIAITKFHASRETMKRDIKAGKITSYRLKDKGPHIVSEAELKGRYLPR